MRDAKKFLLDAAWKEMSYYESLKEDEYDYYGSLVVDGLMTQVDMEEMDRSISALDYHIGQLADKIGSLMEE